MELKKIFKIGSKKEDKIEIWSVVPGLADVIPVQKSSHFMPDWFVKIPMTAPDIPINSKDTIKSCPAVSEFIGMGITVPLWCDLKVKIFDDGSHEWISPRQDFTFTEHPEPQFTKWAPPHAKPTLVLKAECPWRMKTPPGVSLLQLPMLWHFNPTFTVCAGVIWSEFHHEINQQMMFHEKGEFMVQRGTPLAQYIPIRRETFNYDIGDQTSEQKLLTEQSELRSQTKFRGSYHQDRKNIVKKELQQGKEKGRTNFGDMFSRW
jgi:hypothetical protein